MCLQSRLCGYEPFFDESESVMYKKIVKGDYNFDDSVWDNVSENAKVSGSEQMVCLEYLLHQYIH